VRQVMSDTVAARVRHMLLDVVDEGTALQAALDNYLLAGKTGTPRGTVHGHYVRGRYNPNFVGLFPGDNPQYVIVVKLTAPQAAIYAAETAAPVTKAILEAALAAKNAALDRTKLASSEAVAHVDTGHGVKQAGRANTMHQVAQAETAADLSRVDGPPVSDASSDDSSMPAPSVAVPFVVTLPTRPAPAPPHVVHAVPDIRGLGLREAVRSLHSAGFRVQLARGAGQPSTNPASGELAPTGTLVRLLYDY
ncbi:MAG TPA: penicillin-binding transpeptidase domain-containing protein, partial [Gemmatimonadaceae bacterium]|nr:penicillin-binding transpeptidase domain-containing protein [Gemmatimonadaceae bacterium]